MALEKRKNKVLAFSHLRESDKIERLQREEEREASPQGRGKDSKQEAEVGPSVEGPWGRGGQLMPLEYPVHSTPQPLSYTPPYPTLSHPICSMGSWGQGALEWV